ncbi:MAG: DUF2141 domain-containing protein [Pseudomonadota bacterium]
MKKLLFTQLLLASNILTITACGMDDKLKNQHRLDTAKHDKNKSNVEAGRETPQQEPATPVVPDPEIALVKVTLNITKTRNANGNMCLSVFNKAEGFPTSAEAAIIKRCLPAVAGGQAVELGLEPNGRYAIAVFHDENENGTLDTTGGLGIPKEGFGFSSNPPLKIGAPSFEEVAISVGTQEVNADINLKYLL